MSKKRLTKYTNFHHRRNNGLSRPLGRNRQRPNIVIDYLGDLFRSLHTGPVVQIKAQHPIDAHKAIVRLGARLGSWRARTSTNVAWAIYCPTERDLTFKEFVRESAMAREPHPAVISPNL